MKKIGDQIKKFLAIQTTAAYFFYFGMIIIFGWISTEYFVRGIEKQMEKEAEQGLLFLTYRVSQMVQEADQSGRLVANSPEVLKALQFPEAENIKAAYAVIDRYAGLMNNIAVSIIDSQGSMLLSLSQNPIGGFFSEGDGSRAFFKKTLKGEETRFFSIEKDLQNRHYYAAYPLRDSQAKVIGAVVLKKEIKDLAASFGYFENAFLVDSSGKIFLLTTSEPSPIFLHHLKDDQQKEGSFFQALSQDPTRVEEFIKEDVKKLVFNDKYFIVRSKPTQIPGWSIYFLVSAERFYFYRFFGRIITGLIALLFSVFFFSAKTLRKHAQSIQTQLLKLSRAVEQSPSTVVITDSEGKIEYVNPKFCQLTGYTFQEAKGQNPRILKSEKQSSEVYQQLWETLTRGEEWRGEFCNKKKNGDLYWEFASISPARDEKGTTTHYIAVKEDITARKEAEEKAREAMRAKSEFIAVVSHELRTPLTAIKEGISIVVDGVTGELKKEQEEFLNVAKRNVDRLSRLINDVLDFQKLDTRQMAFDFMPQDIQPVIQEAVESVRKIAEKENVELTTVIEENLPKIKIDRDRIIQVIINLVSNAIKYASGKPVCVRARAGINVIEVSIIDQGEGIKEEDFSKLFQTFSQLKKGKERKIGSTGLGLAISKKIVQEHGGKIWVESRLGEGTVFSFALPVQERRQK